MDYFAIMTASVMDVMGNDRNVYTLESKYPVRIQGMAGICAPVL